MSIGAAAACSEHPVVAEALGECAGALLEVATRRGSVPDLLVVACTPPTHGSFEDVVAALDRLLAPRCLVGAVATAVLGGGRVVDDGPAVGAMALWGVACRSVGLESADPDAVRAIRRPDEDLFLLADPFTVDLAPLATPVPEGPVDDPDLRLQDPAAGALLAGLLGAGRRPGANRLASGGGIRDRGAVGVAFARSTLQVRAAGGVHPVGRPAVVTGVGPSTVTHLDGVAARDRLVQLVDSVADPGLASVTDLVLLVGHPGPGTRTGSAPVERVVRISLGGDGSSLHLPDPPPVGATLQPARRDRAAAEAELQRSTIGMERAPSVVLLGEARSPAPEGRASDAALVAEATGGAPLWGIGTVGVLAGRGQPVAPLPEDALAVGTLQ